MVILIMGLSWFPGAMADLNEGLVAYYPFDGNANDQSGNGNHGIVHGATLTKDRFWTAENAYQFDGKDDYIKIPYSESFNIQDRISISVWIKASDVSNCSEGYGQAIIAHSPDQTSGGYNHWLYLCNTKIRLIVYEVESDSFIETSNVIPSDNEWYNVVFISERGGDVKVFVNGVVEIAKSNAGHGFWAGGYITIGDLRPNRNLMFKGKIDDIRIYNRALSNSEIQQLYTMKPVSGDVDLDAAREEGQQECKTNPASCGITIDSFDGLTQVEVDSAKQTARQEGEQACINNPGSCNITIKSLGGFTQAELDSAKQTARQEGKQEGKQACTNSPASCGITIESLGGFTQAQLNAKKDEGITNGKQACIDNPGSCGITIFSLGGFNQAQLSAKKDEGITAGKQTCINNPGSCGITIGSLDGLSQSQLDSAKQTARQEGKQEGKQACIDSPGSCGITIASLGGLSQSERDSAKQTAKQEGKQVCIDNPGSCGITINSFPDELSAAKQTAKGECKANPASCGMPVNPTRDEVKAECQEDPASCGIDLDSGVEGGFLQFSLAGNGVYNPGDDVKIQLIETLNVHRFYRVDLWIIIEQPSGGFLYRTDLPLAPYSPNPTPFLRSLDSSNKTHQILDFEVPIGLGGDYNLYAFFNREDAGFSAPLKTLASNIAQLTITLRNE